MKKVIFLLISIFILSGCNVQYELNVSKEGIDENIRLIAENEDDNYLLENQIFPVEVFIDSPVNSETREKIEGVEYYNTSKEIINGNYNYILNYRYTLDNYKDSNIINGSLSSFSIEKDEDNYTFYFGSNNKAFEYANGINNLEIKVNIDDYEIVDSNASNKVNNTLSWNVTKNEADYFPIFFTIKDKDLKSNNDSQNKENEDSKTSNNILLILGSIILFGLSIMIIIIVKKKIKLK